LAAGQTLGNTPGPLEIGALTGASGERNDAAGGDARVSRFTPVVPVVADAGPGCGKHNRRAWLPTALVGCFVEHAQ
jgi:hypothetical protein